MKNIQIIVLGFSGVGNRLCSNPGPVENASNQRGSLGLSVPGILQTPGQLVAPDGIVGL